MAAKGGIAPSENAENSDLVAAAARRFEEKPDLKANPCSAGTNGSKIELNHQMKVRRESLGRWILNL